MRTQKGRGEFGWRPGKSVVARGARSPLKRASPQGLVGEPASAGGCERENAGVSDARVTRIGAMGKRIQKSTRSSNIEYRGRRRFEHWAVDNQVYFITARCRGRFPAFAGDAAKAMFWDRFLHYSREFGFTPWVTSLLDNHYHTLGYLRECAALGPMMQRVHGSVAKLVNDLLPERRAEFWSDVKGREYFDGCIRDEKQARAAYRFTLTQSRRHGLVSDSRTYAHTHVNVELERAIARSHELGAFLEGVPYKRYLKRGRP
jgi:REP element-mobilizing transposase RayT